MDGMQTADGRVSPQVTIYGDDIELTAPDERAVAAAPIEAADALDG